MSPSEPSQGTRELRDCDRRKEHDHKKESRADFHGVSLLCVSGPTKEIVIRRVETRTAQVGVCLAAGTNFEHHSEIVNIAIDQGRTVAHVESRETNEMTIHGRRVGDVERVIDTFELRGDVMLWTKSTDMIEKTTAGAPIMKSDTRSKQPVGVG